MGVERRFGITLLMLALFTAGTSGQEKSPVSPPAERGEWRTLKKWYAEVVVGDRQYKRIGRADGYESWDEAEQGRLAWSTQHKDDLRSTRVAGPYEVQVRERPPVNPTPSPTDPPLLSGPKSQPPSAPRNPLAEIGLWRAACGTFTFNDAGVVTHVCNGEPVVGQYTLEGDNRVTITFNNNKSSITGELRGGAIVGRLRNPSKNIDREFVIRPR